MSDDRMMNDLIVRFAVMEQMLLMLTAAFIEQSEDPDESTPAFIADLRRSFQPQGPAKEGTKVFLAQANLRINEVAQRLQNLVGAKPLE